jgi:hypothetical protein
MVGKRSLGSACSPRVNTAAKAGGASEMVSSALGRRPVSASTSATHTEY